MSTERSFQPSRAMVRRLVRAIAIATEDQGQVDWCDDIRRSAQPNEHGVSPYESCGECDPCKAWSQCQEAMAEGRAALR